MNEQKSVCLDGQWDLYFEENRICKDYADTIKTHSDLKKHKLKKITGTVPGNFELDFSAAGILPDDLFYGQNILKVQDFENLHLFYNAVFDNKFLGENYLKFFGIDTFADIYLNGKLVYSADNMLIPHEFPVNNLKIGKNEILVHIKPTEIEARKLSLNAGVTSALNYNFSSVNVRKAAHTYGWDIMPRAVSGGIYRSVYLINKPARRINDHYLYTYFLPYERVKWNDGRCAAIGFYYNITCPDDSIRDYEIELDISCKGHKIYYKKSIWHTEETKKIFINEPPHLWWPRGMGEPNLYKGKLNLYFKGELADTKDISFGIRRVELIRREYKDENDKGEFLFTVNGEKMFVHGTNWVPLDAFHSQDGKRFEKAAKMVKDLNCNMLRLWGGNVYEDEELYRFCDENGIAIWQDFAMACATYPRTEEFADKIRKELSVIIPIYRGHPSLFIWCGDNECDTAALWCLTTLRDPNKNIITRRVIPDMLEQLDPMRPYLPSSPYTSEKDMENDTAFKLAENHLWGAVDYYKDDFFTKTATVFSSEIGYFGCPNTESIKKFIPSDSLWPYTEDNEDWNIHAANMEPSGYYVFRIKRMISQAEYLFSEKPDSLEKFSVCSQISQAEALKYFIELFRTNQFNGKNGILWWNLLDGWPQFSDAVVDYYFAKKPAYHVIKRVQQDIAVMFKEKENGEYAVIAANGTLNDEQGSLVITDLSKGKEVLNTDFTATKNSAVKIGAIKAEEGTHFYLIEYDVGGKTYKNHYLAGTPKFNADEIIEYYKKAELIK